MYYEDTNIQSSPPDKGQTKGVANTPQIQDFGPRCEDFAPSRRRKIGCVLYQAAAGVQPSGRALPSLLTGAPVSVEEHVECAHAVNPMQDLLEAAVPSESYEVINACVHRPGDIIAHRLKGGAFLHQMANAWEPHRAQWAAALPPDSPANGIDFPLIFFVGTTLGFPDTQLVNDLACGMPITGDMPPIPTLSSRKRKAPCSTESFTEGARARNAANIRRARKHQGTRLGKACYEKTMIEVAAGWISTPVPVSEVHPSVPLTPRFALGQDRTPGAEIRMVGDFRASGVNFALSLVDTSIPDGLDSILALRSAYQRALGGRRLMACSVDFAHAYKHIPLLASQAELASIVFPNIEGEPLVGRLRTQPFGSSRAPANWARVPEFIKFVLLKLFRAALLVFVDDCFTGEPQETIASSLDSIKVVCKIFGFELEPSKEVTPSQIINLLGARVSISAYEMEVSLPEKKKGELIADLARILQLRKLSPADAGKMRGRLGFAQSFMYVKFGRALLSPFTSRQYSRAHTTALDVDLSDVLPWWVKAVGASTPRRISCVADRPVVAYCDACGEGHLGVTMHIGGQCIVSHTHVPAWLQDMSINVKEMAGALLAVRLSAELAPGRQLPLLCDNTGARGMVIRGTSKNVFGRGLASIFWSVAAGAGIFVWVEYAKSILNESDGPSRLCGPPVK